MTQRKVCLYLACPFHDGYGMCDHPKNAYDDKRFCRPFSIDKNKLIPCPFNVGFEVLDKKQWERVEAFKDIADKHWNGLLLDVQRELIALKESEANRK